MNEKILITIDGHTMSVQPDGLEWAPPETLARDGLFAPVRGQYWSVSLRFGRDMVTMYPDWFDLFDSDQHTAILPHPKTDEPTSYTCYSSINGIRKSVGNDGSIFTSGLDIELSGIVVV